MRIIERSRADHEIEERGRFPGMGPDFYGPRIRHLASVFAGASEVRPSSAAITGLLKRFDSEVLLPTSVQEPSLDGPVPRIGFGSLDQRYMLVVGSQRIDVIEQPRSMEPNNLGAFDAFLEFAAKHLVAVIEEFDLLGTRLACVQEGFLPRDDPAFLDAVPTRLLTVPDFFTDKDLNEWDYRLCARFARAFGKREEEINTILAVKRVRGVAKSGAEMHEFVKVRADLDINTLPENVKPRFGPDDIREFMQAAAGWHADLAGDVSVFINAH